ncbi:unnamed protein product, partial [Polarella glacialis]
MCGSGDDCPTGDCLPPDTQVWLQGCPFPQQVSQVKAGQQVLCHDLMTGTLKYTEVRSAETLVGDVAWVTVSMEDGTEMMMTANHPLTPLSRNEDCTNVRSLVERRVVRAADLDMEADHLAVLKLVPVRVVSVVSSVPLVNGQPLEDQAAQNRVALTLRQPERNSIFVAAPGATDMHGIAVGSADLHAGSCYEMRLQLRNTFLDATDS